MTSRKQEHIEQITERCLIAQNNFSFKERAERDCKYWCKRCRRVNRHFAAPSAWVFVLICVKKTTSSMKNLALRVRNSSRNRNCFTGGYIHSLFVSKALTLSYLARSSCYTNNSKIQPRTPDFLWRELYLCRGLFSLRANASSRVNLGSRNIVHRRVDIDKIAVFFFRLQWVFLQDRIDRTSSPIDEIGSPSS